MALPGIPEGGHANRYWATRASLPRHRGRSKGLGLSRGGRRTARADAQADARPKIASAPSA
jgi:hypothetical protein